MKKVFVSGCYDLLHSGHVEFFRQASQYGELYVGIGSDSTILEYKHHKTFYPERERCIHQCRFGHHGLCADGGVPASRCVCSE